MTNDPGSVSDQGESVGGYQVFWADEVADAIEAREPSDPIVIKGAVSPSGIPHLGHFNEIIRGYFVAEVLRERGYTVRQVFTSDDRDALRSLPRQLADGDWRIVELGDIDASVLGKNLGIPYSVIPDPFGEHESYGDHFTGLLRESAEMVGVPLEILSVSELYDEGEFDEMIVRVLERRDEAREVLGRFQEGVSESYIPFMAKCQSCGKLTTGITGVDLVSRTVTYECTDLEAGNQQIEGCGHVGSVSIREGKLPWRFEWPAEWVILEIDFEPFGKDHAEGSWPSGKAIAREIFESEPPVPLVYEWFTLNGEALSSSSGNVITVPDLLEFVEVEVLKYFFARNPRKQRDLDLTRVDLLVDEFDRFERLYFDEESGGQQEIAFAERVYPFVVDDVRRDRVRLPYTFAAVLGMTDDRELQLTMARREGHIGDETPEWAVSQALDRVELAREWASQMDNEYNYRLQAKLPTVKFDEPVRKGLRELASVVESEPDGEELQSEIYRIAEKNGIQVGEFFSAGYQLFFGQEQGPRLGSFLAALDGEFVAARLRQEG